LAFLAIVDLSGWDTLRRIKNAAKKKEILALLNI